MNDLEEILSFRARGYVDKINDWIKIENTGGVNVLYLNIRGIRTNFNSFLTYLCECINQVHIIVLVEVKIWEALLNRGSVMLEWFDVQGFRLETKLRTKGRGGGIFMYIKKDWKNEERVLKVKHFEACCHKIAIAEGENKKEITVLAVYRQPHRKENKMEFTAELKRTIKQLDEDSSLIVVGDFNINLNRRSTFSEAMKDLISELALVRGVFVNTREEWHGGKLRCSCIDNILVRENGYLQNKNMETAVVKTKISDHYMLCLKINDDTVDREDQQPEEKTYLNEAKIKSLLKEVDWEEGADSELLYDKVNRVMNEVYEKSRVTLKTEKQRKPKNWITEEITEGIRERDQLFKSFRNKVKRGVEDLELYEKYKKVRNEINKKIEKAKKNFYYQKIDKDKNDGRKVWAVINEITGRKKKLNVDALIKKFKVDGKTTAKHVADEFANFFSEGVKKCRHICNHKIRNPRRRPPNQCMRIAKATETKMNRVLDRMKIKTGAGTDKVRMKDIVDCRKNIVKPLVEWVNNSLQNAVIPEECKIGKVRPIYKGGDHAATSNYRPISVLNSMNKILEKYVYDMTIEYIQKNNLIHKNQYGFQPGKRISVLLGELANRVYTNLDQRKYTMCIFIDYQKAFDTLGHQTILDALEDVGISGKMRSWFEEYLKGRKFEVNVGNETSERMDVESGVPQGSFLGPLLFILVANSLWDWVDDGELFMYADDACILLSDYKIENLYKRAQKVFDSVQEWSHDHALNMNAEKTKYIIIQEPHRKRNQEEKLIVHEPECLHERDREECKCTKRIERVKKAKYLGIWIDEHFSWREQVMHLKNKLRACLAALVRLGRRVNQKIKKVVYMALGDSHLNYGVTAWGNCNLVLRQQITSLQNRILRFIYGDAFRKKSKEENIMTIERKYIYRLFVESYFDNTHRIEREQVRVTRAATSGQYVIPRVRTDYGFKQQSYVIPKIWDNLPAPLKSLCTYKGVKFFGKEWAFELQRKKFENNYKIKMKTPSSTKNTKRVGRGLWWWRRKKTN